MSSVDILKVLEAVEFHLESTEIKSALNKCSVDVINSWKDSYSFNLLHHSILKNNLIAVTLLFNRGCFKPPHKPESWPYLHLVAVLGHSSLISTIVQETGYHDSLLSLDWDAYETIISKKIKNETVCLVDADKINMWTPVDLAAKFGHKDCVELFLDFWQLQRSNASSHKLKNNASSTYLLLACRVNSPQALRLLMKENSSKKEALECAIRMLATECVDEVLKNSTGSEIKNVFQGMNLFHVLYSYSCCLSLKQYESMVKITSSLIKNGHNVNAKSPSRTFPLYSLLCHPITGIAVEECSPYLINCLLLLLQAGADPNMDEIVFEDTVEDVERNAAFGRQPYSSALNCILSNLPVLKSNESKTSSLNSPVEKYALSCIDLLLKHGSTCGNSNQFQSNPSDCFTASKFYNSGSALHLLVSTRPMGAISFSIVQQLLHYGTDADLQGTWHMPRVSTPLTYALNVLPFSLWSLPLPNTPSELKNNILNDNDFKLFKYISQRMSESSLIKAYKEFQINIAKLKNLAKENNTLVTLQKIHLDESPIYVKICEVFEKSTHTAWLLQRCCAHTIWRACSMHISNVQILPIPVPLKNIIITFH